MVKSDTWSAFEQSDFAKKVTAGLKAIAKDEKVAPKMAPGPLENVGWQAGNGHVPDLTKFHDIKEVHKAIEDVANKAPTGKVVAMLARLVRTAEAWETSGKPELQPFAVELDGIIDSVIAQHTTASADAATTK